MSKAQIEAILPLSFMQKALLFHKLHQEKDQGLLHVQSTLKGDLNKALFVQAWQHIVVRHEAFRTSIHWENMDKQVQIIRKECVLPIDELDWTDIDPLELEQKIILLKEQDAAVGLDLSKAPISKIRLIQLNASEHLLIWTCHHILFDGWSSAIVLEDVFSAYEALMKNETAHLPQLPSLKNFLSAISSTDKASIKEFWQKELADFDAPRLFQAGTGSPEKKYQSTDIIISSEKMSSLLEFSKRSRVTINTVLQGLWVLVLSKYSNQGKVAFGTTVSGRSMNLPNIDKMAGLFSNLLPVVQSTANQGSVVTWLQELQNKHAEARTFEQVSIDELFNWTNWTGNASLFDTLLIVENFPWTSFSKGGVQVSDFKSGITTTYPLTVTAIPGELLRLTILSDLSAVSEKDVHWFTEALEAVVDEFVQEKDLSVEEILNSIPSTVVATNGVLTPEEKRDFVTASNQTELQLSKLWEQILGKTSIDTTTDFFDLGGDSLLAIRLIHKLKQELGFTLSVSDLVQKGSIQAIAKLIDQDEVKPEWSYLVPLKTGGSKLPLFCLHSGGGYVFFYKEFARLIEKEHPVYGIQPKGLNGEEPHLSIPEMAKAYIQEMKMVQPDGPYHILGYCLSSAILLEVARQLKNQGNETGCLFVLDSYAYPWYEKHNKENNWSLKSRLKKEGFGVLKTAVSNRLTKLFGLQEEIETVEQELVSLHHHIWTMFKEYSWEAIDDPIILVRSSEFANDDEFGYHTEGWSFLSSNQLKTDIVEAKHTELLAPQNVKRVSTSINKFLTSFEGY